MAKTTQLLAAALLLAGCTFDASLSPGAIVTCADGVCPKGLRCHPATLRCISEADYDDVAPGIEPGSLRLTLTPPPASLIPTVTALGPLGRAHVRFAVTEELGTPPVLTATPALNCPLIEQGGLSYEFACEIPTSDPPTTAAVALTTVLIDLAGNRAEVALDAISLQVDSEPPPEPTVDVPGRIRILREPWGSDASGGRPRIQLLALAGAAEPGSSLVTRILGVAPRLVEPDGSIAPLELPLLSYPEIRLLVVDGAGNASRERVVRDSTVVTTYIGKVIGRTRENPHLLFAYPVHGPMQQRRDVEELSDAQGGGLTDGKAYVATGGSSFVQLAGRPPVGAIGDPAATYDAARARVVRYGGFLNPFFYDPDASLWEWTGENWLQITPQDPELDGDPPARNATALAWHAERRITLMYGGERTSYPALDDTWTWNGKSWRQLPGPDPQRRAQHAMAYDPLRGKVVLFGGAGANGALDDTWEWDGTWSQVTVAGPQARSRHGLAWDSDRERMVMVGGLAADAGRLSDVWEFDGAAWTQRVVAADFSTADGGTTDAGQTPLGDVALAFDPERGRMVATSGFSTSLTFELADGGWKRVAQIQNPGAPALTWDGARSAVMTPGQATIVCVFSCSSLVTHTQSWDGSAWKKLKGDVDPWFDGSRLAWVPAVGGVVAAGVGTPVVRRGGAWEVAPVPATSGPGSFAALNSGKALLQVNPTQQTWLLSDAGWTQVSSAGGPFDVPATAFPLGDAVLVSDDNGVVFRFREDAGWDLNAGPLRVLGAAALPDGGAFVTTEYGPFFALGFDPTNGVTLRLDAGYVSENAGIGYDHHRGRLFAFGGTSTTPGVPTSDFFESVDGESWKRSLFCDAEGDGNPAPRERPSMAFEPASRRLLMTGGQNVNLTNDWVWGIASAGTRPSMVFHVSLGDLDLPAGVQFGALRSHALAGGGGGAELHVFRNGGWRKMITNPSATLTQLGSLQWDTTDARELARLLTHQPEFSLAVLPVNATEVSPARVALDSVEVAIDYRIP